MSLRPKTVDCPVCGAPVLERDINTHLDSKCATKKHASVGESSSSKPKASKPALAPIFSQAKGKRPAPSGPNDDDEIEIFDTETPSKPQAKPAHPGPSHSEAWGGPPAKRAKTTQSALQAAQPLPERMRPMSLDDVVGHEHIVGKDSLLRGLIESNGTGSLILWGPAGCGKTTLARLLAKASKARIVELSATSSGTAEVRAAFEEAKNTLKITRTRTILFLDEIHRFNKAQQDLFLPYVEQGIVQLIGATTENPSFKVNNALLSRCRTFVLERLTDENIREIVERALRKLAASEANGPSTDTSSKPPPPPIELSDPPSSSPPESIPPRPYPQITEKILASIVSISEGDARTALSLLELATTASPSMSEDVLLSSLKKSVMSRYDRTGDDRYDMISALHKSVRGSDGTAAMYWLARMLTAGEDPLYIARRCIVMASEDIGLANDRALPLAVATHNACTMIGMPECRINLAHCVAYLAESPKSTRSYEAYNRAEAAAKADSSLAVPHNIRNAPTGLMKDLGYGKGYLYNPDFAHPVHNEFLPLQISGEKFLLKEGDKTGKVWNEDLLRQWEWLENDGNNWEGRANRPNPNGDTQTKQEPA